MAYIIQVSNKDASKMDGLLREAKEQKVWQKYWGNTAFTVTLPEYDASPETKKKYIQMVNVHAAIKLSIDHANLPRILDLEKKISLPQLPDAEGPRDPTKMLVWDVLSMMKIGSSKKKIWTYVLTRAGVPSLGTFQVRTRRSGITYPRL